MSGPPAAGSTTPRAWPAGAMCGLIFAATLAAYWPALHGTLLWDDAGHITRPDLRSLAGLMRIWFEPGATQQYYPLLHSAFWLEHKLWGDATLGYHLVNVLLHATAACLFATILRRLAVPGAWLAALLFALHPVCVESVAWITEQKNTLSLVLALLAARTFLRFDDEGRSQKHYALATLWFALALLAKTVTATLPAALLVIAWWRRDVLPLLPWFALGISSGLLTAWFERTQIGATGADFALGPLERTLLAGRAAWFYIGKLAWPADLILIYPRWSLDSGEAWQWLFPLAVFAALAGLWLWRKKRRGPLAAALLFGGMLFPALGFVNVFPFLYSYVADHFQYHASLAVCALAGAAAATWAVRLPAWVARAAATALLALLGALTWRHAGDFHDVFTLYGATLEKNPACWMAHNNLAIALVDAGRTAEALPHYDQALALRPNYAEAENNLGFALTQLGRPADALPHLDRALRFQPGYADAHNNRGAALMGLGRPAEGIAAFTESIRLKPRNAIAHFNLGLATASAGQPAAAIPHFQRAVELNPRYADPELNWAIALTVTHRFDAAVAHFRRALELQPDNAGAHHSFGRAFATVGRLDEAVASFRRALDLQPSFGDAHFALADALRQLGRPTEAEEHHREAARLGTPPPRR